MEINPEQELMGMNRSSQYIIYDGDDVWGFIMPKSGRLKVYYKPFESVHFYSGSGLYHHGTVPDYSSLLIHFLKGDSTISDSIMPRFPDLVSSGPSNYYDQCISEWIQRYHYLYMNLSEPVTGVYDVGGVLQGDTIRVSYRSDYVRTSQETIYDVTLASENLEWEPDSLLFWSIFLGNYDDCIEYTDNELTIALVVMDSTIDHFEVNITPDTLAEQDTLAFGEAAKLIIQAKDEESNDVDFPADKLLTLKVETNENYGTFIDANGDTLNTTPVILNDVTYGDANEGLIKFAALKENPDSFVTCLVKVYLQEDTTKNGERDAVVLEQTLKLIINNPAVEPIITGRSYDTEDEEDNYLNNIDVENRKPFRVKLTRGGVTVPNHSIKLMTDYVDGGGGHDHINPRRPDSAFSYQRKVNNVWVTENVPTVRARKQNYGSFYSYSSGGTFNIDSLKGMIYERSRQDTVTRFEYVASIWGDEMKIYLESLDNRVLKKDSVVITERVPDLVELQEGTNYELVGTPDNHSGTNDPCRTNIPTSQHYVNHFGTQNLINAVQNIANDYAALYPGIRIRVNDMSLESGGLFDVTNNWLNPHQSHRMGSNADIGFTGINENGDCINLSRKDLEDIITLYSSRPPLPESDHFHLFLD